ncbi:MAG: hypothetical protein JKY65_18095 [Planctomycetes bacterium]|nr:hypothetical protein [Planctomycetota bacterium]
MTDVDPPAASPAPSSSPESPPSASESPPSVSGSTPASHRLFPWACLTVAALALGYLCWAVEDLRQEAKTSSQAVNAHLPQILEKVEGASATLKEVADDLKKLRDLAGASGPRDKSLAVFADRLLDLLEAAPVKLGLEKMIGKELKNLLPAAAWVRDARKEALWLTFRAKSKAELFERLCKNKFGSDWIVELAEGKQSLANWFAERDAEAKRLLPLKEK